MSDADPVAIPEGWERDAPTLYLHASGARIERRIYRQREGWMLVPADLDQKVLPFASDLEGLARAFAAFAEGRGAAPVSPAREAARRDEKLEDAADEEEKRQEAEADED